MSRDFEAMQADAARYWEERYRAASPRTSGKPGKALQRFAGSLPTGSALELGCGKGDDAVWLAGRGWSVVAVEISRTALDYAAANAERAGVSDRIAFEQHDLSRTFPDGTFDLVAVSFLAAFPRDGVFRRAAQAVATGGHLLIIDHGSRSPWSSAPADWRFLTAAETLETLDLDERNWAPVHVDALDREATGPDGEIATVRDSVIFLKRL
ncbi:SAM-dependent methyltransferase [Pseudochelatococcus lubricantis]|uniref:SAM-dependent methyltransferase n=1 Tax=Pseudochelatococcus lubricantis TaxID=1538102 RepID=A0ABX0V415_9HYPH|nr:class I SAM-dependent methyltransferase [Pseudochelatococcus lubricantis]NIJ59279.1 SAM-dependent methyltransferase [Pseudochelatococcus lubricantis]